MYCCVRGTSSILKVTPVKLNCLAMYMPLSFISIATISMAPTPLEWRDRGKHVRLLDTCCSSVTDDVERNLPALDCLDKVTKLSEGCFMAPDAQTVHVGHVSGFRGAWIKKTKRLSRPGVRFYNLLKRWCCLLMSTHPSHWHTQLEPWGVCSAAPTRQAQFWLVWMIQSDKRF